jgi:uncharacterized protein
MHLTLRLLEGKFSVCRLAAGSALPPDLLAAHRDFMSITRTADELSIVCPEELAPVGAKVEGGWRAFKVQGPLDFALTGIIATLTAPLAEAQVSVFTIATFDTDYLLVRERYLATAKAALERSCTIEAE